MCFMCFYGECRECPTRKKKLPMIEMVGLTSLLNLCLPLAWHRAPKDNWWGAFFTHHIHDESWVTSFVMPRVTSFVGWGLSDYRNMTRGKHYRESGVGEMFPSVP